MCSTTAKSSITLHIIVMNRLQREKLNFKNIRAMCSRYARQRLCIDAEAVGIPFKGTRGRKEHFVAAVLREPRFSKTIPHHRNSGRSFGHWFATMPCPLSYLLERDELSLGISAALLQSFWSDSGSKVEKYLPNCMLDVFCICIHP